jgi:hypothetical protein
MFTKIKKKTQFFYMGFLMHRKDRYIEIVTRGMCLNFYVNVKFQNESEKYSIASFPLILEL